MRRMLPDATDFMAGPAGIGDTPDLRRGRRLLWLDGLVSNSAESFIAGFTNPFALALGATNGQIGLLSAFSNLAAALALLPGAALEERLGRRKLIAALTGGVGGRLLLLLIAAMPLLLPPPAAIYAFIALVALRAFISQLGYPAWSALVADLAPTAIRGRYFASRNIALGIGAMICTPLAGCLAESIGLPGGYQVNFLLAGLLGFGATAIFARIPEPPRRLPQDENTEAQGGMWAELRRQPRFLAFTGVAFLWNAGLLMAGPFFAVFMVRQLHASPTQIGIIAAVNSLSSIAGLRFWGRVSDRRGAAWVMRLTGLLIPGVPVLWSLAPDPWFVILPEVLAGLLWSGYSLASFNLLLGLTPETHRSRFIATYQLVVFAGMSIGPLLGSLVADAFSLRMLLRLSGVVRMAAALLFVFTVSRGKERA